MPSAKIVLIFLFNLDAFISFSCLIALARISTTMLNRSGESQYPCLCTDLSGKAFRLSPLIMIAVAILVNNPLSD